MAKRKKHDEEHMSEAWLIPYADVLTLLLAVFIILFSTSQSDQKKFQEVADVFGKVFKGSAYILPGSSGKEIIVLEKAGAQGGPSSSQTESAAENEGENQSAGQNAEALAAARAAMEEDIRNLADEIQTYITSQGMGSELTVAMTGTSELVITIKERALFASGSAEITQECRPLITNIATILKAHPNVKVTVSGHTDNVPISNSRFRSNWELSSARATAAMELLIADSGLNPADFHAEAFGEYRPVATNNTADGRTLNRRVEFSIRGNITEESIIIPMQ